MSHKKGIDKKLPVGAAHGFNSQLFNGFGFRISGSFVCLGFHFKYLDASR